MTWADNMFSPASNQEHPPQLFGAVNLTQNLPNYPP